MAVAQQALAIAGAIAAQHLELGPDELALVERYLPQPVLALAILMLERDAGFGIRWLAAGSDWMAKGELLREVILWVLTPEQVRVEATA